MRIIACLLVSLACSLLSWGQGAGEFSGITEPAADAELSFSVSGVLAARKFNEGDAVREGDVICSLQHQAEELDIQRRKIVLENAKRDLERTQRLFEKTGSVSKEELEEKRSAFALAETDVAIAEEALKRRLLIAPFSGTIAGFYGLDPGEGADLLAPVVRLVDASRCLFICNLPANNVRGVKKGDKVSLTFGEVTREGHVSFIAPVLDSSSGLLTIKATFENPDGAVIPGAAGLLRFQS